MVTAGIGILLLGAAVLVIVRNGDAVLASLHAARNAPAWMLALAVIAPLANIVAVSLSFSVLTGRYGRVGVREMGALITSAWMLNMLPLRPGLIGRVGYHKAVNGIAVRDSVKVLVQAIACNGAAMVMALGCALLAARLGLRAWEMGTLLGLPAVVLGATGLIMRKAGIGAAWSGLASQPWRWVMATALRYVDIVVWVGRYALAFAILGSPLSLVGATVTALASEAAMLSPVQLGLREWVVGVTSAAFAGDIGVGGEAAVVARGLLADMLNRGIEIAVALPVGLLAAGWIMRRLQAARGLVEKSEA